MNDNFNIEKNEQNAEITGSNNIIDDNEINLTDNTDADNSENIEVSDSNITKDNAAVSFSDEKTSENNEPDIKEREETISSEYKTHEIAEAGAIPNIKKRRSSNFKTYVSLVLASSITFFKALTLGGSTSSSMPFILMLKYLLLTVFISNIIIYSPCLAIALIHG
jgi:hypothetical protein